MANHPGYLDTDYQLTGQLSNPVLIHGRSTVNAYAGCDSQFSAWLTEWQPGGSELALLTSTIGGPSTPVVPSMITQAHPGYLLESIGGLWWGRVHVFPRNLTLGNILSTTDTTIDIFNADRNSGRSWTGFTNNAGAGTEMLGLSLPVAFGVLEGKQFTFRVTLDGPGEVNTTLDYVFTGQATLYQPISFTRVLAFPFLPEWPIEEDLEWLTDIIPHGDGTQQRIALRDFPRQFFSFRMKRDDELERQRLENLVFERHAFSWGLPVWHEATELKQAASVSDTRIYVNTTRTADFRVGGSLIIWNSETDYETALIVSLEPTSIELSGGLQNAFATDTLVMPLRVVHVVGDVPSDRYPVGLQDYQFRWRVVDNEVDLAQTNWWSTFNGKLVIDDHNFLDRTTPERFQRPITVIDHRIGVVRQVALQEVSHRVKRKKWMTANRQELWRVRQLLYALRGRQVSFYLPTKAKDLTLDQPLVGTSQTADIVNTGYTSYVQSRQPRNVIRVVLTDGTVITRTIQSSSEISATVERITVDSTWGQDVALNEVERIEYSQECTLASDKVRLTHRIPGRASIPVAVRTVLE